jgi:hypothetical protein
MGIKTLFPYFFSAELQRKLLLLRILFLLVFFGLLGLIIYILRRIEWTKYRWAQDLVEFRTFKTFEAVGFVKKWEKIRERLEKGWEPEAKLALIEADQLLDDLLKRMGYAGEGIGERLKQIDSGVLPNVDQIWEAHKIRNNLVHDPDYKLSLGRARRAIAIYEQAFKHFEAI